MLLPLDTDLRDYALRIGDLMRILASVESRSELEIYHDLLTTHTDVLRIRIADPELDDGSMPIDQHVRIAGRTRDLLLAAASATTDHRPVLPTRKSDRVVEYVRGVRIGQSERGSYVVTVHSRVPPHLRAALPLEVEEPDPFERRVMVQLARALRRLGQVAEQAAVSGRLDAFSEAVPNGVNANLCEAVAGLFDGGEVSRTVLFGFTWAPAGPPSREPAQPIRFGHDWAPIGGKGGRLLRERSSWPDFELVGPVVKLESDAPELSGRVTLVGLVEGRQARVRMELAGPEYWLALEAHGKGQSLRCAGTLVRDGTQFELQAPRDLELEPEEPIPFRLTG